jgi:hypothetical protein
MVAIDAGDKILGNLSCCIWSGEMADKESVGGTRSRSRSGLMMEQVGLKVRVDTGVGGSEGRRKRRERGRKENGSKHWDV